MWRMRCSRIVWSSVGGLLGSMAGVTNDRAIRPWLVDLVAGSFRLRAGRPREEVLRRVITEDQTGAQARLEKPDGRSASASLLDE